MNVSPISRERFNRCGFGELALVNAREIRVNGFAS